jgi:maleylacetate reductase
VYAAYASAAAFASAGSAVHHKIRHVLGGMYNVPHARPPAMVLPSNPWPVPALTWRDRRMAHGPGRSDTVIATTS